MTLSANDLTKLLLLEIPVRLAPARAWRRNVLAAKIPDGHGGPGRFVRSTQLPGEADITGVLDINGVGVRLEVEVKAGSDRIRPAQQVFGDMIRSMGGIYCVAHDVERAIAEITAARTELARRIQATNS
jgi:hypothetical protein